MIKVQESGLLTLVYIAGIVTDQFSDSHRVEKLLRPMQAKIHNRWFRTNQIIASTS